MQEVGFIKESKLNNNEKLKLTSTTLDLEMPIFSINVKIFLLSPLLLCWSSDC